MREAIKTHKEQQTIQSSPSSSYAAIVSNQNANKNDSLPTTNKNNEVKNSDETKNNKDNNQIVNLDHKENTSSNYPPPMDFTNSPHSTETEPTSFVNLTHNEKNSSNCSPSMDLTNTPHSSATEPTSFVETNNQEYDFSSYSSSLNILYNSSYLNQTNNDFTTDQHTLTSTSPSHPAEPQTLYDPLPSLSRVISTSQMHVTSDDDM